MSNLVSPLNVKAICEPEAAGECLTGVLITYDGLLSAGSVFPEQFIVPEHVIVDAYVTDALEHSETAGSLVVLRLQPTGLVHIEGKGPGAVMVRDTPEVSVLQIQDISSDCPKWESALHSSGDMDPVADRFSQHVFESAHSGKAIPYNLFLPEAYDAAKKYPLLFYIHDAGACSTETKMTLWQGIGATTWADPSFQKEHPCIILAPQYASALDRSGDDDMVEATFELVESIAAQYAVDPERIYGTGQSLGTITEIEMSIRRPDFFTAMLLIAGQNDPDRMVVMKDCKMFIIVSRGDPRAYSGMNASLEKLEEAGAHVERAEWDQDGGVVPEEQVEELKARKSKISYAVLKTEERGFQCHMATWQVAYGIQGTKEWLFAQTRE